MLPSVVGANLCTSGLETSVDGDTSGKGRGFPTDAAKMRVWVKRVIPQQLQKEKTGTAVTFAL